MSGYSVIKKNILTTIAVIGAISVMLYQHSTNKAVMDMNIRLSQHVSLLENIVVDVDESIGREARIGIVEGVRGAISKGASNVTVEINGQTATFNNPKTI